MNRDDYDKAVVIFAGTTWQAGMVKNLLENENIEAFLIDSARGTYNPGWNYPGEGGSVRVMVSGLDAEKAREIVLKYQERE